MEEKPEKTQLGKPRRKRKNPVSAADLIDLREKLEWALRQINPMITTLDVDPPKVIEVEGVIMKSRGWKGIKMFIGNCGKALGP